MEKIDADYKRRTKKFTLNFSKNAQTVESLIEGVHMNRSEIWSNIKKELLGLKWVWNTTRQLTP